MEITETKYEWQIGEYFARTWFGEYGTHTDWFKGEYGIATDLVPDEIKEQLDRKIEEIF
jgi:hypothetical protein